MKCGGSTYSITRLIAEMVVTGRMSQVIRVWAVLYPGVWLVALPAAGQRVARTCVFVYRGEVFGRQFVCEAGAESRFTERGSRWNDKRSRQWQTHGGNRHAGKYRFAAIADNHFRAS